MSNDPIKIDEIDQVIEAECCSSLTSITGEGVEQTEQPLNTVHLNLQASGLALQLSSQPPLAQIVELSGKLELVLSQLKESTGRLETAFFRIGFLEAQLEEKHREIALLKEKPVL